MSAVSPHPPAYLPLPTCSLGVGAVWRHTRAACHQGFSGTNGLSLGCHGTRAGRWKRPDLPASPRRPVPAPCLVRALAPVSISLASSPADLSDVRELGRLGPLSLCRVPVPHDHRHRRDQRRGVCLGAQHDQRPRHRPAPQAGTEPPRGCWLRAGVAPLAGSVSACSSSQALRALPLSGAESAEGTRVHVIHGRFHVFGWI